MLIFRETANIAVCTPTTAAAAAIGLVFHMNNASKIPPPLVEQERAIPKIHIQAFLSSHSFNWRKIMPLPNSHTVQRLTPVSKQLERQGILRFARAHPSDQAPICASLLRRQSSYNEDRTAERNRLFSNYNI